MDSLQLKDILLYLVLVIFVLVVTYEYHFWGMGKSKEKAEQSKKVALKAAKRRSRIMSWLNLCQSFGEGFGFPLSEFQEAELKYRIERIEKYIPAIERNIKPKELIGEFKLISFFSVMITLLLLVLTRSFVVLVFLLPLLSKKIFMWSADLKIEKEDKELQAGFPDLFVFINSRLKQGSNARLAPTLSEYMASLDDMFGDKAKDLAIYKFTKNLKTNIMIYSDDSIAVQKLREKYRCAMIINFVNLAAQALSGVDNASKLDAFEAELNAKELADMQLKADAAYEQGMMVVNSVYIIVFQFVVLSWASKIDLSMITKIFGV